MRKSRPVRTAILIALVLSFSWAAAPARGEPGKVYRYTLSHMDGSGAGDELLFVSGSRVEALSKPGSDDGLLLAFEMDGPGLTPKVMKIWELSASQRELFGAVESLPDGKAVRVEVFTSGRSAETVAVPASSWTLATLLSPLNLAFAALKDPEGSFTVSLVSPNRAPNAPPLRFSSPTKVSYVEFEERGGVPTRKYSLEGEGKGTAWVHRDERRLEALEIGDGPKSLKLQLAGVQDLDAAGWEETKRAQLGPPAPTGPLEAVAVKPHSCRVRGYDQEVQCATYPVWENRETRRGRKIGLNIVILPALGPDPQPDPIFPLGGGPGQAIAQNARNYARSGLRQKRAIVLVDQRGTGRSNPLQCSFYSDPIHGGPVDFRLAAGELFPVAAVTRCREKLEKVADLGQYTTAAFADDLNEVRQWLGYGKINLHGSSYGTSVAQVYWRRYPETVRSVMLTGVTLLKSYTPLAHAYAGQRALDLLLAECASQPECKAAFPDTRADLKALKERIDRGVTVTVTNTSTGERQEVRPSWGLVAEGIRFLTYGPGVAGLPLQIRKAAQGDLAPLVQMSIERRLNIIRGFYWGMDFSVTCAEDLPFITEEMIARRTPGTYLGDYRIRQQKAACKVWPRGRIPADAHEPVHSDVPVLLLSGERDPVTPPEFAEQASRSMTNRLHVIVPRSGHGGGGKCTDDLIRDFTDRASVQGLDPSCAANVYGPIKFMTP